MSAKAKVAACLCVLALSVTSCSTAPRQVAGPKFPRGGTLHLSEPSSHEDYAAFANPTPHLMALDPQVDYEQDADELQRCCLVRTLVGHNGKPTAEGGAVLRPDLATALPIVSADGLTWTFRIRSGLHYAPPLQAVEVTSDDFVRALKRTARLGQPPVGNATIYSVIQGFDDYAKTSSAPAISGLETPDPHTLVVHITKVSGDLGNRFALAATAPIPPSPGDPSAPFGVATGHDDGYGRFLAATGPYMIEGADTISYSAPPKDQKPAAGLALGKSLRLVRNPSWKAETDPLRIAYAQEIVLTFSDSITATLKAVEDGAADVHFIQAPLTPDLAAVARKFEANPRLGHVYVSKRDSLRFVAMNLALPPFDDVHVRKAFNYIVDRKALVDATGGVLAGDPIGHLVLDSLENNLLVSYNPYGAADADAAFAAAKAEMRQSRYDANHDGRCDARTCRGITANFFHKDQYGRAAAQIKKNAAKIGLDFKTTELSGPDFFDNFAKPTAHFPVGLFIGWGKDFLNASSFIESLFSSSALEQNNSALLGATPAQLREWGYEHTSVPSVDERIDECQRQVGNPQFQCWAALDQYLMETVVPEVPYITENHVDVTSPRVLSYSYDQLIGLVSPDRIALKQ
ncbi:MAG: ABC transporter substrate-binding protein [Actinomycetota bacterium]|nr:ABC transporter substrate-binding protein [Actinomycetota bacterium]